MSTSQHNVDDYIQRIVKPYRLSKAWDDFESRELKLTEESKQRFDLGQPGQGYIGIADAETNLIHLIPAFNDGDGLPRKDRLNGNFDTHFVSSKAGLGQGGHNAHMQAVFKLNLGKSRTNKGLMGFSCWKEGVGVKFLTSLPNREGRVPNEYLFVYRDGAYELYYVDTGFNCVNMCITTMRKVALNACIQSGERPECISEEDKGIIIEQVRDFHRILHSFGKSVGANKYGLKHFRGRSTHLNDGTTQKVGGPAGSYEMDEWFLLWMRAQHREHITHTNEIPRSLPFEVLDKLYKSVIRELNLPEAPLRSTGRITADTDMHYSSELMYSGSSTGTSVKDNATIRLFEIAVIINNRELAEFALQHGAGHYKNSKTTLHLLLSNFLTQLIPDIRLYVTEEITQVTRDLISNIITRIKLLIDLQANPQELFDELMGFIVSREDKDILLQYVIDVICKLAGTGQVSLDVISVMNNSWFMEQLVERVSPAQLGSKNISIIIQHAIQMGSSTVISKLAEMGVDFSAPDKDGNYPIMLAVKRRDVSMVQALMKAGLTAADLNVTDRFSGYTPLISAAKAGHIDIIQALMSSGLMVELLDVQDENGQTLAMLAIEYSEETAFHNLFVAGLRFTPEQLLHRDNDGKTMAMLAVQQGLRMVVRILKEAGVPLEQFNEPNADGRTPAMVAAATGDAKMIEALIEAGLIAEQLNQADENGATPLLVAAEQGHFRVVDKLLEAGVTPNDKEVFAISKHRPELSVSVHIQSFFYSQMKSILHNEELIRAGVLPAGKTA